MIAAAGSASRDTAPEPESDKLATVAAGALAQIEATPEVRSAPLDARTRRQRFAEPSPSPATLECARPVIAPRLALVLVTRNHESRLAAALAGWRAVLPAFDLRVSVLDLGSVDGTLAVAEAERLEVSVAPGGLARPVEALIQAARESSGEVIVVADADLAPTPVVQAMVDEVRAGAPLVVAAGRRPGLLALDRGRLPGPDAGPVPGVGADSVAVAAWLQTNDLAPVEVGAAELDRDGALVGRLFDRRRRTALLASAAALWRGWRAGRSR